MKSFGRRPAENVGDDVDLGGLAAPRDADGLRLRPPFAPVGGHPPHVRQRQRHKGCAGGHRSCARRLRRLLADRGYDADALRRDLRAAGTMPVIPGRRTRKRPIRHDRARYKDRWRIEAAFCRLKDFRRVATRYDKLAANFASAVALATVIAFWC